MMNDAIKRGVEFPVVSRVSEEHGRVRSGREDSPPCSRELGTVLPSQRGQQWIQGSLCTQFREQDDGGGRARFGPQCTGERESERLVPCHAGPQPRDGEWPEPRIHGLSPCEPRGQHDEGLQCIPEEDLACRVRRCLPRMDGVPDLLADAPLQRERERRGAPVRLNAPEPQLPQDEDTASQGLRKHRGAHRVLQKEGAPLDECPTLRGEHHLAYSSLHRHRSRVFRDMDGSWPRGSGSENFATVFSARLTVSALAEMTRARAVPVPRSSTTACTR